MKKALIVILIVIVILVLAVLTVAGLLAYQHFVTERIMDKGGMENPDNFEAPENPGSIEMLDGNYTYVANEILMEVITGTWMGSDDRWVMTILDNYEIVLKLDGETVLESVLQFTYLQPGEVLQTEFLLDSYTLRLANGTAFGEINSFYHTVHEEDASGRIFMELKRDDGSNGKLEFQKTAHIG